MPLARYFLFVGAALLALLFVTDAMLPKPPVADNSGTTVNVASDLSAIRIRSDRRWPERVEFDTSLPTITPASSGIAEATVPAVADAPVRTRAAFAQLQQLQATQLQTSEPKKLVPKLLPKRRIVASRAGSLNQVGQPIFLAAQQPRPGLFPNTMW
jgi:hypothetical protein